jgi:hypothetical protein
MDLILMPKQSRYLQGQEESNLPLRDSKSLAFPDGYAPSNFSYNKGKSPVISSILLASSGPIATDV